MDSDAVRIALCASWEDSDISFTDMTALDVLGCRITQEEFIHSLEPLGLSAGLSGTAFQHSHNDGDGNTGRRYGWAVLWRPVCLQAMLAPVDSIRSLTGNALSPGRGIQRRTL